MSNLPVDSSHLRGSKGIEERRAQQRQKNKLNESRQMRREENTRGGEKTIQVCG